MQVVSFIVPDRIKRVRFCRIQAFPNSTFHSLFNSVFKKIKFTADIGDGPQEYDVSQTFTGTIAPEDVVQEMRTNFTANDIPIIVLDEFNEIEDPETPKLV